MPYAIKYQIFFKNSQQDNYRVDILEKDYSGSIKELIAGDSPFKLKYQSGDDSIINAIRASEAVVNFWADTVTDLRSFYSEDDEKYRIDLYCESVHLHDEINLFYEDTTSTVVTITNEFNMPIGTNNTDFGIVPGMFVKYLDVFYEITQVIIEPVGGGNYNLEIIVSTDPPHDTHTGLEIWENPTVTTNKLLWSGYLVQDNCQEDFQDPPFLVSLNATDNLGLLKETAFDVAHTNAGAYFFHGTGSISGDVLTMIMMPDPNLIAGDIIYIDGEPYLVASYTYASLVVLVTLQTAPANGVYTDIDIPVKGNLIWKHTLFNYLRICISQTGIALPLRIYANIFENTQDDKSVLDTNEFFSQTRLFTGMFLTEDGTWEDCYSIIEKILFALNATLVQADGCWNIIRMAEAYLFLDNQIAGTEYDANFDNPVAINLDPNFPVLLPDPLVNEYVLTGADAIRRIVRPFKFTKYTFNYTQPRELIRNINLQEKGDLIRTYTTGTDTIREYVLPFWFPTGFAGQPDVFLRTVTNDLDVETDRYIVLKGGNFGGRYLDSSPFYIDLKDRVNISFSVRTSNAQSGNVTTVFQFRIENGTTYYLNSNVGGAHPEGSWQTTTGAVYKYGDEASLEEFTGYSTESLGTPIEGNFILSLNQLDVNNDETHYKDIRVEYIPFINDSTQIIGHTHTTNQPENIKNNFDEEIFIDDSPKHALQGALFTNVNTGYDFITLTSLWHRLQNNEDYRLGLITTFERKLLSFKPRTIIEGTLTGIRYSKDGVIRFLTPLNIVQFASLADLHFVFGVCEFDYKSAEWSATMWELYENEDSGESFTYDYVFKYLYQTS